MFRTRTHMDGLTVNQDFGRNFRIADHPPSKEKPAQ